MADEQKPDDKAAAPAPTAAPDQGVPADALENPDSIDATGASNVDTSAVDATKKPESGFKRLLKRINIYLLLFGLVIAIGAVVAAVSYLNSRKTPTTPQVANQTLTPEVLQQLANSNATVGDTGQTLTVQGNAVFDGQVLVRSNLNVAGTITLGGTLTIPNLTVSNTSNLNTVQANELEVANGSTFAGTVTVQHDLNVGGATSFSGPVTAGQLTVSRLVMSGNAQLSVPNHISFTGTNPGRTLGNMLGAGGSTAVVGSDTAGSINIQTGNGPITGQGCFINVTFVQKFTSMPHVIISPVSAGAAQVQYYVGNRSVTGFSVCTDNGAPANTVFGYDYFVTQ